MNSVVNISEVPRVLVISHNCFSDVNNNGKSFAAFFENWNIQSLAQLYFRDESPSSNVCSNYFKITESLIIKSIFSDQKCGEESNKDYSPDNSNTENRLNNVIYSYGKRKFWILNIIRDFFWTLTSRIWYNSKLKSWIKNFSPECIFLAAGDSAFIYKVAYKISTTLDIPVVIFSGDNYLSYFKTISIPAHIQQRILRSYAKKIFTRTKKVIGASQELSDEYRKVFNVNTEVLLRGIKQGKLQKDSSEFKDPKEIRFLYIGQLGLNRWQSLIDLGHNIREYNKANNTNHHIDIFTIDILSDKIKSEINEAGAINIKGSLTAKQVENIVNEYDILLHVENKKYFSRTKYSMSTKIPEYLTSGKTILAYGPAGLASINYLQRSDAAFVINEKHEIFNSLSAIFNNETQRRTFAENAIELANKNHDPVKNRERFKKIIIDSTYPV
jgi:hypothetical protein